MEGSFDCLGLLFDQLDSVGQKHNFLLLSVWKVVIHWGDCNTGLTKTCREINDWVSILTFLEESFLVIPQSHLNCRSINLIFNDSFSLFVFIIIDVLVFVFHVDDSPYQVILLLRTLRCLIVNVLDGFIIIFENAFVVGWSLWRHFLLQVLNWAVLVGVWFFILGIMFLFERLRFKLSDLGCDGGLRLMFGLLSFILRAGV